MTESRVNHLAWHRAHITENQQLLVYVLLPTWLGAFHGSIELEAINWCGRPVPKIRAAAADLASPRRREDTEGMGHPLEIRLIRHLGVRAGQAGHILPQLVPSTELRGWARLELSEEQRRRLCRAGGVAV